MLRSQIIIPIPLITLRLTTMFGRDTLLRSLLATLFIKLAFAPGLTVHAQVQPGTPTSINSGDLTGRVNFAPPTDDGAHKHTVGTGCREGCPGEFAHATPVTRTSHYGLTASARPSIFIYIPQRTVQEVFFSLKDENNNHLFQTRFAIPNTRGLFDLICRILLQS